MNKIKKLSAALKYLFYTLLVLYPLFNILFWIDPGLFIDESRQMPLGFMISASEIPLDMLSFYTSTTANKIMGFLIQLTPNLLTIAVFYYLAKLFALYEDGKIFLPNNYRYLKITGILLLTENLAAPIIFNPLLQLAKIIQAPTGKMLSISFSTNDLYSIFVSLLIILISWVMAEACKINEEQQLTI